jgi:hypothetical protein
MWYALVITVVRLPRRRSGTRSCCSAADGGLMVILEALIWWRRRDVGRGLNAALRLPSGDRAVALRLIRHGGMLVAVQQGGALRGGCLAVSPISSTTTLLIVWQA